MASKKILKAGDIQSFDVQADVYQGRFELVSKVPGEPRTWICRHLPDAPEVADQIRAYWAERKARGSWSPDGKAGREIADRAARVGETFKMKFVSADEYARYF